MKMRIRDSCLLCYRKRIVKQHCFRVRFAHTTKISSSAEEEDCVLSPIEIHFGLAQKWIEIRMIGSNLNIFEENTLVKNGTTNYPPVYLRQWEGSSQSELF